MRMTLVQLKRLSIETVSGIVLGRVQDIVCELDGQLIVQYLVASSRWSRRVYTISRDQVVRFEPKKMIVDDNTVRAADAEKRRAQVAEPEPVAMREEESSGV